jgi:TonB family protein
MVRAQIEPQSGLETPTAEYRETMRAMAAMLLKFSVGFDGVAADAAKLHEKLADVEMFWAARNVVDAVNFAKAAGKAATDLEAAAIAQDEAQLTAARAELTASCLGCHKAHVGRRDDQSFAIVAQASASGSRMSTAAATAIGVYLPGGGVTSPSLLQEVKPRYTPAAMRMRAQGEAWLECIVRKDGSLDKVRIVRSLDPVFGLDDEALIAARQWKFTPGTRNGEPVDVLITIAMTFTLR